MRGKGSTVKVGYFRIEINGKKYIYDEKKKKPGLVEEEKYREIEETKNGERARNARRKG